MRMISHGRVVLLIWFSVRKDDLGWSSTQGTRRPCAGRPGLFYMLDCILNWWLLALWCQEGRSLVTQQSNERIVSGAPSLRLIIPLEVQSLAGRRASASFLSNTVVNGAQ